MQEKMSQDIQSVIERAGGLEAIRRNNEPQERLMQHFWENENTYLKEYPRKWIVVTLDGVAAVGDGLEEITGEVRNLLAVDAAFHVEYLNPEPESWLL